MLGVMAIGSSRGKVSSRRFVGGNVAVVTWRGRDTEGGVLTFLMTCENELEELSSGLKEPLLGGTVMDCRREMDVGMEEIDMRFTRGYIVGLWVILDERMAPLGFRVVPLALLSLLSREALDKPLVFVLRGEVTDMRDVEVLWDTLVEVSDEATFFVLAIAR